ncbi:winged helix-turn-helix domain-containing protein [Halomicrococcus sp. NG-SE-24]|uniref:winged helix-turn-helix domain-containing protein n=1 Tax=Halomicrococcus sp. NG-SE-24 TaxID=3436928 RepID=UPI003D9524C6
MIFSGQGNSRRLGSERIASEMAFDGDDEHMSDGAPDDDPSVVVEKRSPVEVFELLSSGVRVEILRALGETPNEALTFSSLYERVDIADSGNFNYHLGKLVGSFVRESDGYELTHAGKQVVGAMYAGTYTTKATVDPISVGWDCLLCGGEMVVSYDDEKADFRCTDCEKGARFSFPAGSLDQFEREELPQAFARWWHQLMTRIADGFCSICAGRLDGELASPPGGTEDDPQPSHAEFECRRCGGVAEVSGATLATFHPVVEGFFAEHGFDVSTRHGSQVWGEMDAFDATVLSEDPLRLEMRFEHAGETVVAEIDPDATVSCVERRPSAR